MLNKLYLEKLIKKGYVVIQDNVDTTSKCESKELAGLLKSFSSMGFMLNQDGILKLSEISSDSLACFYHIYYPLLKKVVGSNVKHTIFYKNFPDMGEISDLEYYCRAVLHYLTVSENSDGFMNQDINDFSRKVVSCEKKTILKVITVSEAEKILIRICENYFTGKVAIPYVEKDFLTNVLNDYNELINIKEIPFKENIAYYFDCLIINSNNKKKISFGVFFLHIN